MRCPVCNHETADGSLFCGNCGAKLSNYVKPTDNSPQQTDNTAKPEINNTAPPPNQPPVNENPSLNENQPVNNNYFTTPESPQQPQNNNYQSQPQNNRFSQQQPQGNGSFNQFNSGFTPPYAQQPNFDSFYVPKKKSKAPIISIIAIILVAAIIGGLYYFGVFDAFNGPLTNIAKATSKTLDSKSFNISVDITSEDLNANVNGTVIFDPDTENLELYLKADNINKSDSYAIILIKNNVIVTDEDGHIDSDNISDAMNDFWDDYNDNKDINNTSEIDWEGILKSLGLTSSDVDYDKFAAAANEFIKNLNDKDYINEKLGEYKKENKNGTTNYNFVFKSEDVSEELINVFGDSIKFRSGYTESDAEKDLNKGFNSIFGKDEFELNFATKSGYLSGFSLNFGNSSLETEFSDFGNAQIKDSIFDKYKGYFDKSEASSSNT